MHKYGPTFLTTKIALKDDLSKLICCTEKLPAVSEVVEGTVMQLIYPQMGYVATHFYRVENGRWMDVTNECGPVDRHDASGSLKMEYEVLLGTVDNYIETWTTGYLDLWWTAAPEVPSAGDHLYDVVVRKPCKMEGDNPVYPVDPNDGEIIVRAPKGTVYTYEDPYRFDDVVYGTDMQDKYCYRLFHVYASGWWSYVNGPYLNQIREKN